MSFIKNSIFGTFRDPCQAVLALCTKSPQGQLISVGPACGLQKTGKVFWHLVGTRKEYPIESAFGCYSKQRHVKMILAHWLTKLSGEGLHCQIWPFRFVAAIPPQCKPALGNARNKLHILKLHFLFGSSKSLVIIHLPLLICLTFQCVLCSSKNILDILSPHNSSYD